MIGWQGKGRVHRPQSTDRCAQGVMPVRAVLLTGGRGHRCGVAAGRCAGAQLRATPNRCPFGSHPSQDQAHLLTGYRSGWFLHSITTRPGRKWASSSWPTC